MSPELRWYPVVTFLQLGLDMAIALAVPIGHGHYYAPEHYIDAWVAVTDPPGWAPEEIARLKAHFIAERAGMRRRRAGWVGAAGRRAAAAVALAVAGNVLTRYRGWTVERLEPDALSAMLAPGYRVRSRAGEGPFPTALLFSGCDGPRDNCSAGRSG